MYEIQFSWKRVANPQNDFSTYNLPGNIDLKHLSHTKNNTNDLKFKIRRIHNADADEYEILCSVSHYTNSSPINSGELSLVATLRIGRFFHLDTINLALSYPSHLGRYAPLAWFSEVKQK